MRFNHVVAVAVQSGDTSLGNVPVSSSGLTIYGRMKDTKSNSTCVGASQRSGRQCSSTKAGQSRASDASCSVCEASVSSPRERAPRRERESDDRQRSNGAALTDTIATDRSVRVWVLCRRVRLADDR